jgi:hypothetical protein
VFIRRPRAFCVVRGKQQPCDEYLHPSRSYGRFRLDQVVDPPDECFLMRRTSAGLLLALSMLLSGCDPSYCARVYGTVETATGEAAPIGTMVRFYLGSPPADTTAEARARSMQLDSVRTQLDGYYEREFRLFLVEIRQIGISSMGSDTVAAIRSGSRSCPRTRVDLRAE